MNRQNGQRWLFFVMGLMQLAFACILLVKPEGWFKPNVSIGVPVFFLAASVGWFLCFGSFSYSQGQDCPATDIKEGSHAVRGILLTADKVGVIIQHFSRSENCYWPKFYEFPRSAFVGDLMGKTLLVTKSGAFKKLEFRP